MKQVRRMFPPGSEWIYFKIYAGNKTIENILSKEIFSIITNLQKEKLIDKWFFIRYEDPDYHVRIRFLLKNKDYACNIVKSFYLQLNYLVEINLIWKIQLDTYNRELERYNSNFIEETESIFYKDSECVIALIKGLRACQDENYRWMIALKLIDCLLSDFSLDLHLKQQLLDKLSQSYKLEFGFNQYNSKQFNAKYRDNKNVIESVLNDKIIHGNFNKLCKLIKKRSLSLSPIVCQLQLKLKAQNKETKMESLLSSYIHMTLNRLFISKNRIHELVVYDFLRRYYTSEIAKNNYNPPK